MVVYLFLKLFWRGIRGVNRNVLNKKYDSDIDHCSRVCGYGEDYYGRKDYNPIDRSYIATKWKVFLFLPIVPIKSYRLIKAYEKERFEPSLVLVRYHVSIGYRLLKEVPLSINKEQIIRTYLIVYVPLVIFIVVIIKTGWFGLLLLPMLCIVSLLGLFFVKSIRNS